MALVRNAIWNLSGQVLPLAAAIVVIPFLLRSMGTEGFGLVTILWTLIGYFSLFDFGLGRALTKFVSMEVGQQNLRALPDLITTAMTLLAVLGVTMACLIWLSVPWMVTAVLKPKISTHDEVAFAFHLAALAIPFVVINVGLRAILEGILRFDLTNLIRVPFGLFTIISPAVVHYLGYGLDAIVIVIGVGILIAMLGYSVFLRHSIPGFAISAGRVHWATLMRLLRFGGWVSVSNFIQPILFYLDRFLISAMLTVSVMAYYVAPYEAITKTLILSSAVAGSLFPIFAKLPDKNSNSHISTMLTGSRVIAFIMMPLLLLVACFRYELLELWVGQEVAIHGSGSLLLLCAGVFFNAIAYMPFTLIQASGRADLVAKIHLVELLVYPCLLWVGVSFWHLEGAAVVWSGRALFEMLMFFIIASKVNDAKAAYGRISLYILFGASIVLIGVVLGSLPIGVRGPLFVALLAISCVLFWAYILSPDDKSWIKKKYAIFIGLCFRRD